MTLRAVCRRANTDWRVGSVRNAAGAFVMPWLGEGDGVAFKRPSLSALFRWLVTRRPPRPAPRDFSIATPDFQVREGETRCTWLGHATCLLQTGGVSILTDAVFSERCSPVQWLGPRRFVPPACSIAQLPPIDVVLTSHDHYDHLDWASMCEIERRFRPVYVCGLELGPWFVETLGAAAERVVELDWWERVELADGRIAVQFLPTQHWSKRRVFGDTRRTLWGAFSVASRDFSFFFNGDTGYSAELYAEIGRRCGPFDLCAIPIGAYAPRDIMRVQHVDPDEAFAIHRALRSRCSFGIHHATFILTDEPVHEPAERIRALAAEERDAAPFLVLQHGAAINLVDGEREQRTVCKGE